MTTVRFTPGLDGHVVQFAYNPAVVELIKQTVPGYARSWSPQRRVWTVDPAWSFILADILRLYGHTVTGLDDHHHADCDRHDHHGDADWARILFHRVGPTRAGPVFRSLSRILHPDTATGDTVLQRELIGARFELKTTEGDAA